MYFCFDVTEVNFNPCVICETVLQTALSSFSVPLVVACSQLCCGACLQFSVSLFTKESPSIQIQCQHAPPFLFVPFYVQCLNYLNPVQEMPFQCTLNVVQVFPGHIKYKKRVAHLNVIYNIYFGDFCTLLAVLWHIWIFLLM